MIKSEMGNLVDKLAEKLNTTVDRIKPLAEQTLSQYRTRAIAMCIIDFVVSCVLCVFAVLCIKIFLRKMKEFGKLGTQEYDKSDSIGGQCFIFGILGFFLVVFTAVFFGHSISHFTHIIAPLPSILGL